MINSKMTTKLNFLTLIMVLLTVMALMVSCGKKKAEQGERGVPGENGINGVDGSDGVTPHIGENNNWWIGDIDTGILALGQPGKDGEDGKDGLNGKDGSTPTFKFDETAHVLSVSYDAGNSWHTVADLSALFNTDADGSGTAEPKDGITPMIKIDAATNCWEVSYDEGVTWTSLGVCATGKNGADGKDGVDGKDGIDGKDGTDGKDGVDGKDGKDGKDAVAPQIRINESGEWEILPGGATEWISTGIKAVSTDGITPELGINEDGMWQVRYGDGAWKSLGVAAQGPAGQPGINGETPTLSIKDGKLYVSYGDEDPVLLCDFSDIVVGGAENGKDGRGIKSVAIVNGNLVVYYTDNTSEVVGTVGESSGAVQTSDVYTDVLDFYPINGGTEYAVAISERACYLTKIVIPASYNGLAVTTILAHKFQNTNMLEEVVLPDSIIKISNNAFEGCTGITKLNIPSSVTYIGSMAFFGVQEIQVEISESEAELRDWEQFKGVGKVVYND